MIEMTVSLVLAGLPAYLATVAVAFGCVVIGGVGYLWITPHPELALVRAGNEAVAHVIGAAMVAIALPIAAVVATTQSTLEVVVWSVVAVLCQIVVAQVARFAPWLARDIAAGNMAPARLLATLHLVLGIIMAGVSLDLTALAVRMVR